MKDFNKIISRINKILTEDITDSTESHEPVVEMGDTDTNGTGLMGHLYATYDQIYAVFGEPTYETNPEVSYQHRDTYDKVSVAWYGKIDGQVFSIYDYKSPTQASKNRDWHIGARKKEVADKVIEYFKSIESKLAKLNNKKD